MNNLEGMDLTEYAFLKIKQFVEPFGCDFGYTRSFFTIGQIKSLYVLRNILDLLEIQNKYEVFIETERIQDELYYSIAGCRKDEVSGI